MLHAAIVGMGWWGRTVLDAMSDSAEVRTVMAVDPAPAALHFAQERGLATTTDFATALSSPHVDAVVLCTPHQQHHEQVIAAAQAGKHVFCEKPFSMDLNGAESMVRAAEAAGVHLGIGHEKRFEPGVQYLNDRYRVGDIGTGLVLEANFSQNKFLALPADNWRLSVEHAPAGPLSATGIHLVDLAVALFGWPDRVWARLATMATPFANGDTLSITIGFPSGATALLTAILTTPFMGRLCLLGSEGRIEVLDRAHPEDPKGWNVTLTRHDGSATQLSYPAMSAVRTNLEAFARHVTSGEAYPFTTEQILATAATTEAIMTSIATDSVCRVAQSAHTSSPQTTGA
ncbi:gfo/Idh/MocA family oxidoreductase [Gordonia sp. HNM0687]|uniref:Gfo/Idh/MocA family oxidoreductase n=1 Tax=Gordonia mangrovi TaxID=2665643 RepID=A0A6L7GWJ9_9ACTN|nr:Gfo/Idh/MocA family oxidoreductase [Gordonia mangrovi]MXP23862.1 gfo/Idh/MocA family oxidoreductase [Gordonia mangrovi]UVF76417.1 Gfo/Idh/MocA family oxidoreductase [Gordonia mangrovi]